MTEYIDSGQARMTSGEEFIYNETMRIGIDISQLAYENTGVANYLKDLVENLLEKDTKNEYILFYSSLRRPLPATKFWDLGGKLKESELPSCANVTIAQFKIPPTVLHILWNMLHVLPIENFIGPVDVFLSSDWTQPPSKAKKATILYDLIIYMYPQEMDRGIVSVHKRRLKWVKKEVDKILCISEATKKDAMEILHIPENRLAVVYPGL